MSEIVSYPSGLPLPQVDGFGVQSGQVFTTSEPSDGPSRYRLDRVNPSAIVTANLVLTRKQRGMFAYFYDNQLGKAMRWFYMPLLYDTSIRYYLCHLREIPNFTLIAGHGVWTTTFDLEVDVGAESFASDPSASSNFASATMPIIVDDNPVEIFEFYPDIVLSPGPFDLLGADILQSEGIYSVG